MRRKIIETPNRFKALGIGGLLALSLHALFFSFMHMRDLRQKDAPRLQGRDNTPELLQFASQEGPTEPSKNALSPRSPELPPPAKGRSIRRSLTTLERQWQTPAGQPPSGPQDRGVHPSARLPAIKSEAALNEVNAQKQRGSGRLAHWVRSGTPLSTRADSSGAWAPAIERLRAMGSQESSAREGPTGDATSPSSALLLLATEGKGLLRLDNESNLGRAYHELWGKGVSQKTSATIEMAGMTSPVQIRRVPWSIVRVSELPIRHGQVIAFEDRLLLFWLQDDALHLLQTSRAAREGAS